MAFTEDEIAIFNKIQVRYTPMSPHYQPFSTRLSLPFSFTLGWLSSLSLDQCCTTSVICKKRKSQNT